MTSCNIAVLVLLLFNLYTELIKNSRDAVRANQRRCNVYGKLDKVQGRRAHVDGANRGGFFARLLEPRFD